MPLNYTILQKALQKNYARYGRGYWSRLADASGLHRSGVSKIAKGETLPTPESWERLHAAMPDEIPAVQWIPGEADNVEVCFPQPAYSHAQGIYVSRQTLRFFPGLRRFLEILNAAAEAEAMDLGRSAARTFLHYLFRESSE